MLDQESQASPSIARREAAAGVGALYAVAMAVAVGLSPLVKACESIDIDSYQLSFLMSAVMVIPFCVMVGYAFAIPLLWFRSVPARYGFGVLAPLPLWFGFLISNWATYGNEESATWSEITACLMMGLIGGAVPISVVTYACRWRIGIGATKPIPVGIGDFLALITFGAVVLAYLSQSDLFEEELPAGFMLMIICFYALIGAAVFACLLLSLRIMLGIDQRPFRLLNLIGVVLTMLVTSSVWIVLLVANEGFIGQGTSPVLVAMMYSAVTWIATAASAAVIGWWLRRCGLRLTTR